MSALKRGEMKILVLEYFAASDSVTPAVLAEVMSISKCYAAKMLLEYHKYNYIHRRKLKRIGSGGAPTFEYHISGFGLAHLEYLQAQKILDEAEIFISGDDDNND